MRILYITNGFPPERWAGTESYTSNLAQGFAARGAHVKVLCGGHWVVDRRHYAGFEDYEWRAISVRRLRFDWTKAPDPFACLYDNPVAERETLRLIDAFRPNVIHVTSCETLSASVLRAAKSRAVPLLLSLTDFWFLCPRITLLRSDGHLCDGNTQPTDCVTCVARDSTAYRWSRTVLSDDTTTHILTAAGRIPWLARRRGLRGWTGDMAARKAFLREAMAWPDVRMTASPLVRRLHLASGSIGPIEVQPYGHDVSGLRPVHRRTSGEVTVGYIGQLIPSKGAHLLLQAVRELPAELTSRLRVLVYGDLDAAGAYGEHLKSLAASTPTVEFCGTYDRSDSSRIYGSFDVLAVPSLWHDFPLVLHEAFATRTPVIATNLGGLAESVLQDRNGLLFERGDVSGLTRQLCRLLAEPGLLDSLREGIGPVRTVEDDIYELEARYRSLTHASISST